jgi:ribosomal protein S18 acetylase RimI-like enzyme
VEPPHAGSRWSGPVAREQLALSVNAGQGAGDQTLNEVGDGIGHEAMTQTAASTLEFERLPPVRIKLLGRNDWRDLRSVRLAALRDSPDAFVARLDDELARSPREWRVVIERSAWAGAWVDERIVAIACLSAAEPDEPKRPFVESVWVTPQHRRQGLVQAMLHELEKPARAERATHLQLWVLETNQVARDAYLKLDFHPVPERAQDSMKRRGDGTSVQEHLMVKQLW